MLKIKLIFLILLPLCSYAETNLPQIPVEGAYSYFESLEAFSQRVSTQINDILIPQISNSQLSLEQKTELTQIAVRFEEEVLRGLQDQKELYQKSFGQVPGAGLARLELLNLSKNVKWAIELAQFQFIEALQLMDSGFSYQKIKKRFDRVALLSEDLAARRNIRVPVKTMLNAFVARSEKFLRTLFGVIFMALTNHKLNKIIDWTPRESLTSQQKPTEYKFYSEEGVTQEFSSLPKDAVLILAMNHDFGSLDAKELKEFAKSLGVDRNIMVSSTVAWPQIKIFGNPDPDIVVVEDKMWMSKALHAFKEQKSGLISLSIFPEGAVPLWGTQAPLPTYPGVFRLARAAAIQLRDVKPVYYLRITSNFLTHVTSGGAVPLTLSIRDPELVPTDLFVRGGDNKDPWMAKARLEFEQAANQHRQQMYDLESPAYIPDTKVFRVRSFPEVKPIEQSGLGLSCRNLFIK
ncbi:hypothetical protein K2X05_05960 [bacterium]|nr:hypothetical protein [bacterium]